MIQPLKNVFLVSANESANEYTESGIWIDRSWDKYKHAVRNGIIRQVPLSISKKYKNDVELKKGDKIYFHHFTVQPDNYILDEGHRLYKADYFNIYCVIRKGNPVVIEDWLFASPVMETEEDITKIYGKLKLYTKASPDRKKLLAKAEFISKEAEKQGLKAGDTIIYKNDADYEMTVEGKLYYRMKLANVAAVVRDGNVVPLRDEVLIETNFKEETLRDSGIILVNLKPERTQQANIHTKGINSEYQVGDSILYIYGTGVRVEYEGKKYCILRQEEVLGIRQEA